MVNYATGTTGYAASGGYSASDSSGSSIYTVSVKSFCCGRRSGGKHLACYGCPLG